MFLVLPLCGATLVMATYGLGRRLGSANLGVIAAWLVATSPVVLAYMIQPMSDVPASAVWALAFYLLFGRQVGSAIGAGFVAGIATLIHPNHVPSAVVMGCWLVFAWRDARTDGLLPPRLGFVAGYLPSVARWPAYWWLLGHPALRPRSTGR
jgi:4-amino-4-deoxy-L-arabinose transferase-like glycosyltransferase